MARQAIVLGRESEVVNIRLALSRSTLELVNRSEVAMASRGRFANTHKADGVINVIQIFREVFVCPKSFHDEFDVCSGVCSKQDQNAVVAYCTIAVLQAENHQPRYWHSENNSTLKEDCHANLIASRRRICP